MAFDNAIEGFQSFSGELLVPEEFRKAKSTDISDELTKLYKLYQDCILTKEEFESQKKKILNK